MIRNLVSRWLEIARERGLISAIGSTTDFLQKNIYLVCYQLTNWELIREVNGSDMILNVHPIKGEQIEISLAISGVRESGSTELFKKILIENYSDLNEQVTVFDIGANIGYYALLEAKILSDNDSIYAIEADPNNARKLEQNVCINDYDNIDVHNVAAGNKKGDTELSIKSQSNKHSVSSLNSSRYAEDTITVTEWPIDELVKSECISTNGPVIIRIDVEGYEHNVLEGMHNLLQSTDQVCIFIEVHTHKTSPEQILDIFDQCGLTIRYISPDGGDSYRRYKKADKEDLFTGNIHLFATKRTNAVGVGT